MFRFKVACHPLRLACYAFERPLHTFAPLSFSSSFWAFSKFCFHVTVEIFIRIEIWTIIPFSGLFYAPLMD